MTHNYSTNTGLLLADTYASNGVLGSETVQHTYSGSLDLSDGMNGGGNGYAQYVTYDAWSRPQVEELGSATSGYGLATVTNTYDAHTGQLTDQLVKRTTATPANVDETGYTYDLSGNITAQTETRLGSASDTETQCFTYDALDRLTAAWSATDACAVAPTTASHAMVGNTLGTNSAYWTSWTLFTQGSRNTQTQHAISSGSDTVTTDSYSTTVNGQLTATSTTGGSTASSSYGYDTAGNTTSRTTTATGAQTLTWNNAGQLTQVANTTAGTASNYVYAADGNLLLQKDPTATVLYLEGQQITLTASTKTAMRYYPLPGGGTVVRTGATTNYSFELTDQHGTANLYLDYTAQDPTWRQFDPYGNPRGTTAIWLDNRTFLNKTTDTTTGLTNLGARSYDPTTGRFISLDPVFEAEDPEALPGYTYTDDNPITQTDPTGTMTESGGGGGTCTGNCTSDNSCGDGVQGTHGGCGTPGFIGPCAGSGGSSGKGTAHSGNSGSGRSVTTMHPGCESDGYGPACSIALGLLDSVSATNGGVNAMGSFANKEFDSMLARLLIALQSGSLADVEDNLWIYESTIAQFANKGGITTLAVAGSDELTTKYGVTSTALSSIAGDSKLGSAASKLSAVTDLSNTSGKLLGGAGLGLNLWSNYTTDENSHHQSRGTALADATVQTAADAGFSWVAVTGSAEAGAGVGSFFGPVGTVVGGGVGAVFGAGVSFFGSNMVNNWISNLF